MLDVVLTFELLPLYSLNLYDIFLYLYMSLS